MKIDPTSIWKEIHGRQWKDVTIKIFNDEKKFQEYENTLRSE